MGDHVKKALTDKQLQFCKEYLIDLNATQAAIRAGYSKKTAKQSAYQLFTNIYLLEYIQKEFNKQTERTGKDADWVVKNLIEVVERCMSEKEFNPNAANRSLELIGKHYAMFTDKFKIEGVDSPLVSFRERLEKRVAELDMLN
ncbi:hypothetical protein LCGC14_3022190 [marine sediment metagenome]|uniref:Terminase small subunit n=1 Tax=marine sediment metagenome TaxID=412755 RepID=A0A0F8Z2I0_9ZZZZ